MGAARGACRAEEIAERTGLSPDEVRTGWAEIERRREATRYLHAPASLVEPA